MEYSQLMITQYPCRHTDIHALAMLFHKSVILNKSCIAIKTVYTKYY